jgi:predicted nuclease of predicted toxin-antitoxin system
VKLLFDENLPPSLSRVVANDFPGSAHVEEMSFVEADDRTIFEFARREDFTIVTRDNDFALLSGVRGSPPKIILLRVGNARVAQLHRLMGDIAAEIAHFIEHDTQSLLIVGPSALSRSRRR